MNYKTINTTLALVISCALTAIAQLSQFNVVKPRTTGVPGEEVRVMKLDLDGNLWIAGRFYFWQEVGVAMLSADQLDHQPLPRGGFTTRQTPECQAPSSMMWLGAQTTGSLRSPAINQKHFLTPAASARLMEQSGHITRRIIRR